MNTLLDIAVDAKDHGARPVLRGLRLRLAPGETVSLVGASGCGKSTLLAIAAGLDGDYRGTVCLDGQPLRGPSPDIGMVFQEPRLFPWLTVAQNIAFGAPAAADAVADVRARVAALLDEVGLAAHADALPKQLSGGQAQRAALARGLFTSPRVLLLDEPFSAVDAFTRIRLQELLACVAQQRRLAVLVVTHDIDEALVLGDRVLLMDAAAGPVRAEFALDLPRPRDRAALGASPLRAAILDSLHAAHAF